MAGMIDNADSRIVYEGGWGNWTQPEGNYNDTCQFINLPTGGETATLEFVGTGVEVITVTNADRGLYEVWIDGKKDKDVDTYSAQTKRQVKVYEKTDLEYGKHTIKLVVKMKNLKPAEEQRLSWMHLKCWIRQRRSQVK